MVGTLPESVPVVNGEKVKGQLKEQTLISLIGTSLRSSSARCRETGRVDAKSEVKNVCFEGILQVSKPAIQRPYSRLGGLRYFCNRL
jgi:hypothetical protein